MSNPISRTTLLVIKTIENKKQDKIGNKVMHVKDLLSLLTAPEEISHQ